MSEWRAVRRQASGFFLLLVLSSASQAEQRHDYQQPRVAGGPTGIISRIDFVGNSQVAPTQLLELLACPTGQEIEAAKLAEGFGRIDGYYENDLNLASPGQSHVLSVTQASDVLTVTVREGVTPVLIDTTGLKGFDPDDFRAALHVRPGQLLRTTDLDRDMKFLDASYAANDFLADEEVAYDEASRALVFSAQPLRWEAITFKGFKPHELKRVQALIRSRKGEAVQKTRFRHDVLRISEVTGWDVKATPGPGKGPNALTLEFSK